MCARRTDVWTHIPQYTTTHVTLTLTARERDEHTCTYVHTPSSLAPPRVFHSLSEVHRRRPLFSRSASGNT